jgi:DNA-directed RNA polymerase subunit RPC12/RpoP
MSEPHHSLTAFERPRCPHCQVKIELVGVSPGPTGFEHRLFNCPKCNHAELVVVASDLFKSKAVGLLSGKRSATIHSIKDRNLSRGRATDADFALDRS